MIVYGLIAYLGMIALTIGYILVLKSGEKRVDGNDGEGHYNNLED